MIKQLPSHLKRLRDITLTPGRLAAATAQSMATGSINPLRKEIDTLVTPIATTYEQTVQCTTLLTILFNDKETFTLLYDFAERYWQATHPIERTTMAVSAAGDILVTILLIILTAGTGAAANIAIKAKRLEKVADLLFKITKILKRIGPRYRLPKKRMGAQTAAKKTPKPKPKKKGVPEVENPSKNGGLVDGNRKKEYGDGLENEGPKTTPKSAYQIAKEGGKHKGFLKQHNNCSRKELLKTQRKLNRRINEHENLIKNPKKTMEELGKGDWDSLDLRQQKALLAKKWPSDIQRQKEQLNIVEGLLDE